MKNCTGNPDIFNKFGRLCGIPVSIKENLIQKGMDCTGKQFNAKLNRWGDRSGRKGIQL